LKIVSVEQIATTLTCPAGQTIGGVWNGPTTASGFITVTTFSDGSVEQSEPDYNGAYCAIAQEPPFQYIPATDINAVAESTGSSRYSTGYIEVLETSRFYFEGKFYYVPSVITSYTKSNPYITPDGSLKLWTTSQKSLNVSLSLPKTINGVYYKYYVYLDCYIDAAKKAYI
jgi:hypothetical protein